MQYFDYHKYEHYEHYSNECWAKHGNEVREQAHIIEKESNDGLTFTLLLAYSGNEESKKMYGFLISMQATT